jgi:hypothetical protein
MISLGKGEKEWFFHFDGELIDKQASFKTKDIVSNLKRSIKGYDKPKIVVGVIILDRIPRLTEFCIEYKEQSAEEILEEIKTQIDAHVKQKICR